MAQSNRRPQPVRQVRIPKAGKPGDYRTLGIPTFYDWVCQQAALNRLEPIFEPVFDDANFGYRRGRSTKVAQRAVWKEIERGREWVVGADLKDFFGSVDHEKLLILVAQRGADGRVLRAMLTAGSYGEGPLSDRAGHAARRGDFSSAQQHSLDAVRFERCAERAIGSRGMLMIG